MTENILCTQKRAQILALAKRLADDGAHYLWGAEAHKPTRSTKHLYAPVVLSKDRADESCFCAAKLLVQGELYVCAGRCLHPDLAKVSPQTKVVNSGKSDANVLAFIDKYGDKPDAQYGWGFELTPRVIKGKDIRDYKRNLLLSNKLVWGEGCDDTLHFDCGGFV